jgi:hypothetical protein
MSLLLADFSKGHFLQFWAQGARPSLLFSYTPLKDWAPEDKKDCLEIIELVHYAVPGKCFASDIDSELTEKIRKNCYNLYLRTYFRQWRSQFSWKYSWLDLNNKFESYVQYFWNAIKRKKITVAVFNSSPHNGSSIILYYVCKAANVRTVIASQSLFPNALLLHEDIEGIGLDQTVSPFEPLSIEISDVPQSPFYMKGTGREARFLDFAANASKQVAHIAVKALTLSFIWNPRSFEKNFFKLRQKYRIYAMYHRSKPFYSEYDSSKRYIYFPLHLQPEQTTDILGGDYVDQLLAIEELARVLPKDVLIYVKENPKQTIYMRDPSFFRRLGDIPSVRYLPVGVSTFELTKNALALATVTGTAGWEAIQMGKPAICFGYAWYRGLPGVFEWEKIKRCATEAIFGFTFDKDALRDAVCQRSRRLWPGILDEHYGTLVTNYNANDSAAVAARSILSYMRIHGFNEKGSRLVLEKEEVC